MPILAWPAWGGSRRGMRAHSTTGARAPGLLLPRGERLLRAAQRRERRHMPLLWHKPRNDKIFINYRRDDAGGFAGRLSDTLTAHFGDERVFRDVTGIDYGHDFERVIDQRVAESCAIVVLIGDKWATIANA